MEDDFDFDYVTEDEEDDLGPTQEAIQRERDERDAALDAAGARIADEFDKHAEEREALGGELAWWAEENGSPPIDIVSDLANQSCGYTGYLHELAEHGLPLDAMPATVVLNHLTGPLISAALQALGVLHAHLREDITAVLKMLHDATPVATTEEEQAYETAAQAVAQEHAADLRKQFEAQGTSLN